MNQRKIIHIKKNISEMLPERDPAGHKGTFGKVFIYSGSYGSAGCALLAGRAAYRTGAGMVKISSPECNRIIIQTALPEALYDTGSFAGRMHILDKWSNVYLAGPGIGTGGESIAQLDALINGSGLKPLVLDADALTIISSDAGRYLIEDIKRQTEEGREIILTPHGGELHRLMNILPYESSGLNKLTNNLTDAPADDDRIPLAVAVSDYLGCTVASKGAVTYTISPGKDIVCNDDCGNSGMGTAGSGDVLAGIIVGLLAQGLDAFNAASYGVRIHALAGDNAAKVRGEHGLMAGDIAEFIY